MKPIFRLIALFILPLFLLSCGDAEKPPMDQSVEIREYKEVGEFKFIDQRGQPLGSEALEDKVWVANFVFTSCAAECLIMSRKLQELQGIFAEEDAVSFASFSIDPRTDTPERLASYAEDWEADPNRWHFFTGPVGELDSLIKQRFLLPVARTPKEQRQILTSNFIHSNKMAVVDQQGVVRAYVDGIHPDAVEALSDVIRTLLAEPTEAAESEEV